MPRPMSVLPSDLTITFIDVSTLPKSKLDSYFKIRRAAALAALRRAERNNPRYYVDIQVDEGRLNALPEDDIPEELLGIVRQNRDDGVTNEDTGGYEPIDEEEYIGCTCQRTMLLTMVLLLKPLKEKR